MQEDWLSVLVKVKAQVEGLRTEEVLKAYTPLLAAVGMQCSAQPTVSDMLFFLLKDKANSNPPVGMVDTSEFVSTKSGALDKVCDDCLKLALSFLASSDRCKVEGSCKRLFHLSRAAKIIAIDKPPETISEDSITRIAARLAPRVFVFKRGDCLYEMCKAKPVFEQYFRDSITDVHIEEIHFDFMDFPQMRSLKLCAQVFSYKSSAIVEFVRKHKDLLESVEWQQECDDYSVDDIFDMLRIFSEMSQLRTLKLDIDVEDMSEEQLQRIEMPPELAFSQLTHLELLNDGFHDVVLTGLSAAIKRIVIVGDFLQFAEVCAKTCHLPVEIDFEMDDAFDIDNERMEVAMDTLKSVFGSGKRVALRQVSIHFAADCSPQFLKPLSLCFGLPRFVALLTPESSALRALLAIE